LCTFLSDKPNVKSRLGAKAVSAALKQSIVKEKSARPLSVKERLGLRAAGGERENKTPQSGVVKLTKSDKGRDIFSRIGLNRETRTERGSKSVLLLPQITIKNKSIEDRTLSIKQKLGLIDDASNDSDYTRRKKKKISLDEEIMNLIEYENMDIDIDIDEVRLLSKKDKKRLLKKLLAELGREDEYELYKKKKKRSSKKKKSHSEDDGGNNRRQINVRDQFVEEVGGESEDDFESLGDEIVLEDVEEVAGTAEPEAESAGMRAISRLSYDELCLVRMRLCFSTS